MNIASAFSLGLWGRVAVVVAAFGILCGTANASVATDEVRRAVERQLDARTRDRVRDVRFAASQENRISEDERRVSGRGNYTGDSGRVDFSYSGKVNIRTRRVWDLYVTVDPSDRDRDRDRDRDWDRDRSRGGFGFQEPRSGQRVSGSLVRFSGYGDGPQVRLDVYEGNRRVTGTSFAIRNGRWSGTVRLGEGNFRAVAHLTGSNRDVSVYFTVRDRDRDDRGRDRWDRDLRITSPRERSTVNGWDVDIAGYSDSDEVRIRVYDWDDRKILDRRVRVRDGRWGISMARLREGGYHADVETIGRRDTETVHFRVR